jgi:FKBP-type peptidyl-prolyl cis-trans isomerase
MNLRRLFRHRSLAWGMACAGLIGLPTIAFGFQGKPGKQKDDTSQARPTVPAPPDVAKPPAGARASASGLVMRVLQAGSGDDHPTGDDCMLLSYTAWKRDGTLFSTSGLHGESIVQCLTTTIPGISEAVKEMVTGEKRRIWVPAESASASDDHVAHHEIKLLHKDPETPRVPLTFDVELIRIMKAPPTPADLRAPPESAFSTPGGVRVHVLREGSGTTHPAMTNWVTLNYSGWTTDGKLFESTIMSGHSAAFLLGTVLPGWREALQYMVQGEKARIWVPVAMAYGQHPPGKMFPAGDLVYDIELISFQ